MAADYRNGLEEVGTAEEMVLVTGGTGFLGGWCVVELLARGYRVRTTVRDLAREPALRAAISSQVTSSSGAHMDPERQSRPGNDERLEVVHADLRDDAGWAEAVTGCDYVLHVASPFPPQQPADPDELIVPAREGTLRVLGAALDAGVGRIVVTSSIAAVRGGVRSAEAPLTEEDWTPESPKLTPYVRSKTIAERAAWELARERGASERLAVVNPGAILGPVLSEDFSYSLEAIERLLKGMPGTPRIGFSFVDVRDVADLHIRAMLAPEAGGERFIAVAQFLWMAEVAAILRERLGEAAAKVPSRTVPDLVVRAMGIFDPGIRSIVGQLGQRVEVSSEKARRALGWSPRPVEETIVDCARSLVDQSASAV